MINNIKNRVEQYIKSENLFSLDQKIILAISGGADSVCLMYIFLELELDFELAHCNFNLRGSESEDDEVFIKELANKYKLKVKWLTPCEVANGQWYIYGSRRDCPLPTVILNNYIIGNAEKKARALNFQHWHLRENMMACQGPSMSAAPPT